MKRILLIDDEGEFRQLLKYRLKGTGNYKIITAKGGDMGIWFAHCHAHKPDLVLLDILMPGINGLKLLEMLKSGKDTSHIPVIIITGMTDIETRNRANQLGCDDYMVKPIDVKNLISKMDSLLL